jgi:hypothetical protein
LPLLLWLVLVLVLWLWLWLWSRLLLLLLLYGRATSLASRSCGVSDRSSWKPMQLFQQSCQKMVSLQLIRVERDLCRPDRSRIYSYYYRCTTRLERISAG